MSDRAIAKQEIAKRLLASRSLIDFCAYVDPGAAWEDAQDKFLENKYRARHLQLIADTIHKAMDGTLWDGMAGDGKNILLITTPPGHWKSSLVSRKLPAFFVGQRTAAGLPHQVILTSYNSTLAESLNGHVLELIQSPLYKHIFPEVKLSERSRSSQEWALAGSAFASCKAAGVGGGLTGYHAAMAIVDDPIKDRKDANSLSVQMTLWDWWRDVLRTRLIKDSRVTSFILGIWTRWTENDPAGKIFQAKKKEELDDKVYMLRLPALAETQTERESAGKMGLPVDEADPLGRAPGEALWEEMESAAEHEATKKAFPVTFDSLYQGRPRPPGGYVVGESNFKMLAMPPDKNTRWVWASDWAITQKQIANKAQDPDYTVIALIGLWLPTPDDARLVIAYMARGQLNQHDAREMVTTTMLNHPRRLRLYSGQANIDKVYLNHMRRDPRLLNYRITNLSRKELAGDKVTKAGPWLERTQAGQVYVVSGGWVDDFFNEVENFPNGAHDDMIDTVSVASVALGVGFKNKKAYSQTIENFG